MSGVFDKLNLRPMERRLVVFVGILLFLVVQFIYIWPHFGDVGRLDTQRQKALNELKHRQDTIAATNKFAPELRELERGGMDVPPEDQSAQLVRTIQAKASQAGVGLQNVSRPFTRTNDAFFLEQSVQVTALATEGSLVNFLHDLGSGDSLIRVRDLTLRPDPSRMKLTATMKLVASFQKAKPVPRGAANAGKSRAKAGARVPARTPVPKPSTAKRN